MPAYNSSGPSPLDAYTDSQPWPLTNTPPCETLSTSVARRPRHPPNSLSRRRGQRHNGAAGAHEPFRSYRSTAARRSSRSGSSAVTRSSFEDSLPPATIP